MSTRSTWTATQAMTGQGGWPMTVFSTPTASRSSAGTYFPTGRASGQPALRQAWREDRARRRRGRR